MKKLIFQSNFGETAEVFEKVFQDGDSSVEEEFKNGFLTAKVLAVTYLNDIINACKDDIKAANDVKNLMGMKEAIEELEPGDELSVTGNGEIILFSDKEKFIFNFMGKFFVWVVEEVE